jgi:hypothetical protein
MPSTKIIELEQTQELQDLKIVKELFFEPDTTQNFILELNTIYKDMRVIFHYYKDWTRTKRNAKDALIEKEIHKPHIKPILDTLDANYNTVTATQENYNQDIIDDDQEHRQKESSKGENKEEKKGDGKKTYPINKYSQGIPLAESILINNIPYFIQINEEDKEGNKAPIFYKKFELSDIDLVPPERTEYLSKEYNFASVEEIEYFINRAKNETLDSLFQLVKSLWTRYIDIDEDFINICASDTIFSYFQDKMGMCHYLLIVGDNNTGKSNILLLFSILCYRALYDTSITPANIYNFCGQLEEAQGVIIEDEMDDIDFQDEKKKLYKVSYRSGTKITRMYDNINNSGSNKKSSRQQAFLLYCLKIFASEKMPNKKLSKGFLERVIQLKTVSGDPEFDISEVVNDAGDEQFKKLHDELMNTRKLLLMYRLLHHNDTIPNVELNIKNRYKQLTKPLIRLFQNSESRDKIINSLSKYIIEKNEEKINSLDSALLTFIINLVSKHGDTLYNEKIWEELKIQYPAGKIEDKPYSWFVEGQGSVSKQKITDICETKFGAKQHKDRINGRGLIFSKETLNKLTANYSIIEKIEIIKEDHDPNKIGYDRDDRDTFTEYINPNIDNVPTPDSTQANEPMEIEDVGLKTDENIKKKVDASSLKVSQVSQVYLDKTDTKSKIKAGLFTNPLISESDLLSDEDYDYDPEIINNITRNHGSDRWFCNNCTMRGDKWFMMKHPCKNNINNKGGAKLI